jgi:hypothetical protein
MKPYRNAILKLAKKKERAKSYKRLIFQTPLIRTQIRLSASGGNKMQHYSTNLPQPEVIHRLMGMTLLFIL